VTTVRQLLDEKRRGNLVNSSGCHRLAKMADKDIGSLVVMDGEKLVGVITERHYARNVFLKGKASPATRVGDIMEKRLYVAAPETSVEQCMALMTDKRIRHLPVVDGEKLIGVISIGDLVKSIIGNQTFIIGQLEHYIRG
jgi:CBS domain-containing protein